MLDSVIRLEVAKQENVKGGEDRGDRFPGLVLLSKLF